MNHTRPSRRRDRETSRTQVGSPSADKIIDIQTRGAIPAYRGSEPYVHRTMGLPNKRTQSLEMVTNLLEDVRNIWILVCSADSVSDYSSAVCTPSTKVPKRWPDRTTSTEIRLISDVRLVNHYCAKSGYPLCLNHTLGDISHRARN